MRTVIWWIRRDLRLHDNMALKNAVLSGLPILPVFIIDPSLIKPKAHNRQSFLFSNLKALDECLKSHMSYLIIREGKPEHVLNQLTQEYGCTNIFAEEDFTPYSKVRDRRVTKNLPLILTTGLTAHHPSFIVKPDGKPYLVFTPFRKAWNALPLPCGELWSPPEVINTPIGLPTLPLPEYHVSAYFPPGEEEARSRLDEFLQDKVSDYHIYRDRMDLMGTSSLSPYLRMGVISICRILNSLTNRSLTGIDSETELGINAWKNELIWREFYQGILYNFPFVQSNPFNQKFRNIQWRNSKEDFTNWKEGSTGFPIIDAAMNQLMQTGWMHNRARMIVASFLTKDLLINWQEGEKRFMDHLIDGDLAANNGGWQWTAGVGTDAAPYFRIFNPILQSKKFDPEGAYIRKWVPALQNVPDKFIHEPGKMPILMQNSIGCKIGKDYPTPIIDRKYSRERTFKIYNEAKSESISKNKRMNK